jgi:dipeptidyl aminopeptidase/acylaminoacyl peptidase
MQNDNLLHQLLNMPTVANARLSPDGCWVAFVWYRRHENADVFVVPCDGSRPPITLTHTPEFTWLTSWIPDSSGVIVEEDHDSDEYVRLFRVNLDQPGEMHLLTEDRPSYFIRGGDLHPNGSSLFYGANYDFSTGQISEATWIYRHELVSDQRTAIARPEKPIYMLISLNKPGTHVLYSRKDRHPSGQQFYLVDIAGEEDKEILNFGDDKKVTARWFPDGEQILFVSESTGAGKQEHQSLGVYRWSSEELRWLIDDPNRMIEDAWVTPDGIIVVDEMQRANHKPSYIDPQDWVERRFPSLPGNLLPLGLTPDGTWIARYYSSTSPVELVRLSHADLGSESPALTSLTQVWNYTQVKPEQLVKAEDFTWTSDDGLEIQGWLYRANPNPRRAVLYIHGGPTFHSEDKLNAMIQYFVATGFNVLDVNYRGSTGFGLNFREAIKEDGWGGKEQADIACGAKALIQHGLADAGRVGVTGVSYGGYSAWYLITHYPAEVIGAAAPVCGMTDLVVDYETTRPDLRPYSEEMIGGRPDQIPQKYYERSPINYVQEIRGKLFVVHGANDPNVTPENVRQVRERLNEHQIPYELLVFPDEGHGIIKQENQKRLYRYLVDFLASALG